MPQRPETLVAAISAAIAAHDPLDPWLVQSNYDEHYWEEQAERIAPLVERANDEADVYQVVADVVQPIVGSPTKDDYVTTRLQATAAAVWRWLERERAG